MSSQQFIVNSFSWLSKTCHVQFSFEVLCFNYLGITFNICIIISLAHIRYGLAQKIFSSVSADDKAIFVIVFCYGIAFSCSRRPLLVFACTGSIGHIFVHFVCFSVQGRGFIVTGSCTCDGCFLKDSMNCCTPLVFSCFSLFKYI